MQWTPSFSLYCHSGVSLSLSLSRFISFHLKFSAASCCVFLLTSIVLVLWRLLQSYCYDLRFYFLFIFSNPWFHRCAFLSSFWNLECLGRDSFFLLWRCKPNMMLHVLPFLKLYYWRTKAMKCNCGFRWTRVCVDCREATLLSLSLTRPFFEIDVAHVHTYYCVRVWFL